MPADFVLSQTPQGYNTLLLRAVKLDLPSSMGSCLSGEVLGPLQKLPSWDNDQTKQQGMEPERHSWQPPPSAVLASWRVPPPPWRPSTNFHMDGPGFSLEAGHETMPQHPGPSRLGPTCGIPPWQVTQLIGA